MGKLGKAIVAMCMALALTACPSEGHPSTLKDYLSEGSSPSEITGKRRVAFVTLDLGDGGDPANVVDFPHRVTDTIAKMSHGRLTLEASVFEFDGSLPEHERCNRDSVIALARQRLAEVADPAAFDHIQVMAITAQANTCPKDGSASGANSAVWHLEGAEIAVHEVLHNLGLGHAGALRCREDGPVRLSSSCLLYEYGDPYSRMGSGSYSHLSLLQRAWLGWIDPDRVRELRSSERVELGCRTGTSVLMVPYQDLVRLSIEPLCRSGYPYGALIRLVGSGNTTALLDATPETANAEDPRKGFHDAWFQAGTTFAAPGGGVTVRVEEASSRRLAIDVEIDPAGSVPGTTIELGPTETPE